MNYPIHKSILIVIFGVIIIITFTYLIVFGRALKQDDNHINIALALPRVILTSEPTKIDNETYLAYDTNSFIGVMEKQGFTHIEQLGSAHIFIKNGERYIVSSKMYSSYFTIFSYPTKINNSH